MAKASIKVKIDGLEPLLKRLGDLPAKTRKKILRPLISKAGTIVLKSARQRVPVDEGWLKKSLGQVVKVYKGNVVVIVGPRTGYQRARKKKLGRIARVALALHGAKQSGRKLTAFGKKLRAETKQRPTQYAHLVEYGHAGPRPAPPHAFMRPAWDGSRDKIRNLLETGILAGIEQEASA